LLTRPAVPCLSRQAQLDEVSAGKADWKQLLTDFWHPFAGVVDATKDVSVTEVIDMLDRELGPHLFPVQEGEGGADPRDCPACGTGKLGLKLSRTVRASDPAPCCNPAPRIVPGLHSSLPAIKARGMHS